MAFKRRKDLTHEEILELLNKTDSDDSDIDIEEDFSD